MKKIFQKAFLFVATMTLSLGFASCSDDDDPVTEGDVVPATELSAVANTYVNDVIYPTYGDLRNNAKVLKDACDKAYANAKAGNLSDADIKAACEAFKNARREWERSEAFLYGSASDNELDPHIDSWPLDHDELVNALKNPTLVAGFKGNDPAKFVSDNNSKFQSVLGFHGMEFVLFREGKNRTVDALKANEKEEGMTSVKGIDELAFLQAVAADVRNITALLEFTWMGSAASNETKSVLSNASYVFSSLRYNGLAANGTMCYGQFLLSPSATTGYTSWQGTIRQIFVGGCSNICAEVADQKLGQAYRTATGSGSAEDSRDYIESPYSHRSFIDYQDNIYSIKNTLYGTRDVNATAPAEHSLLNLLKAMNYSGLNDLTTALNNAIQALETAKNSGKSFVEAPGAQHVKNCIDAVSALDEELNKAGDWVNKQDAL